jgi:hypothetical protein
MDDVQQGPVTALNAAYSNSIHIDTSKVGMRSLSFTLGKVQHEA